MKDALSTVVSLLTLLLRPVAMSAYDGGDRSAGAGETLMLLTSRTWETFNTDLPPLQDVAQGNSMIAALTTDGEAYILRRHWSDKLAASPGTATLFAKGVSSLHGNEFALLALADDGRVLPFKDYESWSPSSLTRGRVLSLVSTERAFAALLNDTSVVAWGYHDWGGDTSAVADEISGGVTALYAMQYGFLAVKVDGTVVTWGWDPMAMEACDLKLPPPQMTSTNFISVHDEFHGQIVALAEDGTMYNWGCVEHAWAPPGTTVQLEFQTLGGVISVARTSNSGFAALRQDGSVTTWGLGWYNWINSIELASELATGVKSVHGRRYMCRE